MDEEWQEIVRRTTELTFVCNNDHSVTVYSSDPYYPDGVECPFCDEVMGPE